MHAANCRDLAAQATNPSAKESFTKLAEQWERLASELESAEAFLIAMAAVEPQKPPLVVGARTESARFGEAMAKAVAALLVCGGVLIAIG
jgi:hypothetical protein